MIFQLISIRAIFGLNFNAGVWFFQADERGKFLFFCAL